MNNFDLSIYNFIYGLNSPGLTMFMRVISSLGSAIVIITALLCIFLLFKDKKIFLQFFTLTFITKVINHIIKIIVKRDRPSVLTSISVESGYSFPSAHTMVSTVFYGFMIYLIMKNIKNKKLKNTLAVILSLVILLIGISRIYLGVHYATDVIFGFIFGLIILFIFVKLVYRKSIKNISFETINNSNNSSYEKEPEHNVSEKNITKANSKIEHRSNKKISKKISKKIK